MLLDVQRRSTVALLFSIASGVAIWVGSPVLTGHLEPWDAENPLPYLGGLVLAGALASTIEPRGFWKWPIGIYVGQTLGILYRTMTLPGAGVNFFVPLGMAFLVPYTTLALLGAVIGAAVVPRA